MTSDELTDARATRGNRLLAIFAGLFAAAAVSVILYGTLLNWQFIPEGQLRKVQTGMPPAQVIEILGEPGSENLGSPTWIYHRKGLHGIFVVQFEDGKVRDAFNE